jgi:hypothetical protein
MELESLTCANCSSIWSRNRARGKKPTICPVCIAKKQEEQFVSTEDLLDDNSFDIQLHPEPTPPPTTYSAGSKWMCKSCDAKIKIGVGINHPPTHACKKRLKKVFPLEKI